MQLKNKHAKGAASLITEPPLDQPNRLQEDNARLIARVSELQCKLFLLEEKLAYIEDNAAEIAKESANRKDILQSCFSSKINKPARRFSLSSHVENIREALHGKMPRACVEGFQRMLEEALVKNIELQNNLEQLAAENYQLKERIGEKTAVESE
ncbi:uncharacterized protein LOC135143482 [Zophobas morio]|uniref:uncharacterized protein LOC135143482 n=1 Tax=Zophobas morio TaxID=2755281 RepID=UPI003082F869